MHPVRYKHICKQKIIKSLTIEFDHLNIPSPPSVTELLSPALTLNVRDCVGTKSFTHSAVMVTVTALNCCWSVKLSVLQLTVMESAPVAVDTLYESAD